jgi:diguanylate cyclase (GGDEF)-like protein/PAS domain S-box-containing protein
MPLPSASFLDSPIHALLRETAAHCADHELASETLYRTHLSHVIDSAMDAIITLDGSHCVLVFNAAAEKMFGIKASRIIGTSIDQLIPVRLRQAHEAHLQRFAAADFTKRIIGLLHEMIGLHSDGTEFPIEGSISKITVRGQQLFTIILRDIGERRKADDALHASEERYQSLVEQAIDGIFVNNPQGVYVDANRAGCAMLGYTRQELLGRNLAEIIDPEEIARIGPELARLSDHHVVVSEWHFHRKDGSVFPGEVRGRRLADGRLQTIVIDVSERNRIDADLRIAAIAFESQEALLVTDVHGTILRVNEAFVSTTGYEPHEVIGKNPRILKSGRHPPMFYAEMWRQIKTNGCWMGEVWEKRKNGEIYPKWLGISSVKNAAGAVTHYVGSFTDISKRKEAIETISQLAYYDTLTGLPNRALMMDRLAQALAGTARSGEHGAVLFVDLDHFKKVNDTLGHKEGDKMLQEAARRLRGALRQEDTVSRFGGDEFVVLLHGLGRQREHAAIFCRSVADKLLAALAEPYRLRDTEFSGSASIGVVLWRGSLKANVHDLLKRSDLAMYEAKRSGRNSIRFFDPLMQTAIEKRVSLERDLREAIRKNQFVLHFQAQVDGQNRVTGAEVLVRWQHPDRGLVFPDEFIGLAEETGMILPLGRWVLESACAQLSVWAARPETAQLSLAVNISGHQIHQPEFVDQVLQILECSGADPRRLKLELTETMLMRAIEDIIGKISTLSEKGLHFALDDFGTGYSSLSQLKRLPLKCLKIDRSFVMDILTNANDATIAKSIVGLAKNLGLSVIAEGVETKEQRDFLARIGCHMFQGYLFSQPLPMQDFERFLGLNP